MLVADHGDVAGETGEYLSVTVAKDHLLAVPHGIVETVAVMNRGDESHPFAVDRVAEEDVLEEAGHGAGAGERFVHLDVLALSAGLVHHKNTGEVAKVLGVVHAASGAAALFARRRLEEVDGTLAGDQRRLVQR